MGQRGRFPEQPLGYVMSTKGIFRRAEVFVQWKSVFRDVRMSFMFERKAKISCNGGRSVTNNMRARQDYMRTLGKQTSAGLKITFVDMTYPGQHPELPSLSRHFFLVVKFRGNLVPSKLSLKRCLRLSPPLL